MDPANGQEEQARQWEMNRRIPPRHRPLFRYRPLALLLPTDGPRGGDWTDEEHWIRAAWRDARGRRQERVLNISEVMSSARQDDRDGLEYVLLDMWSSVQQADWPLFCWIALALIGSSTTFAVGLCAHDLPRVLLLRTLAAVALGPLWFPVWWASRYGVWSPPIRPRERATVPRKE